MCQLAAVMEVGLLRHEYRPSPSSTTTVLSAAVLLCHRAAATVTDSAVHQTLLLLWLLLLLWMADLEMIEWLHAGFRLNEGR